MRLEVMKQIPGKPIRVQCCECHQLVEKAYADLDAPAGTFYCEEHRPVGPVCTFAQYNRLRLHVSASKRDVIRAARKLLAPSAKTRAQRIARHDWLRSVLHQHDQSFILYAATMSGKV